MIFTHEGREKLAINLRWLPVFFPLWHFYYFFPLFFEGVSIFRGLGIVSVSFWFFVAAFIDSAVQQMKQTNATTPGLAGSSSGGIVV